MASKREDFRIFETSSNYELTPIFLLQYISFFIRDEEMRAQMFSWNQASKTFVYTVLLVFAKVTW